MDNRWSGGCVVDVESQQMVQFKYLPYWVDAIYAANQLLATPLAS